MSVAEEWDQWFSEFAEQWPETFEPWLERKPSLRNEWGIWVFTRLPAFRSLAGR